MGKKALITGISGQDGSYLAELLLAQGYEVHGITRHASTKSCEHIAHLAAHLHLHRANLLDQAALTELIADVRPGEVYNLAAQSFVPASIEQPVLTAEVTALGVARLLEAIRVTDPAIRFCQASSSEMFGAARQSPQDENTPYHPRSPYGVAKVYGHYITACYRELHGLYACSGILFNHESPRRGRDFVTRKITEGAARIKLGLTGELRLGNLQARRDWGFAGDFVQALWLMLQQSEGDDYVISSGEVHSVEEFVSAAFDYVGLDWRQHVVVDPQLYRPTEKHLLQGNPGKVAAKLGWRARMPFGDLVAIMVDADLKRLTAEEIPSATA